MARGGGPVQVRVIMAHLYSVRPYGGPVGEGHSFLAWCAWDEEMPLFSHEQGASLCNVLAHDHVRGRDTDMAVKTLTYVYTKCKTAHTVRCMYTPTVALEPFGDHQFWINTTHSRRREKKISERYPPIADIKPYNDNKERPLRYQAVPNATDAGLAVLATSTANGGTCLYVSQGGYACIHTAATGSIVEADLKLNVAAGAISPDGSEVILATQNGHLAVFNSRLEYTHGMRLPEDDRWPGGKAPSMSSQQGATDTTAVRPVSPHPGGLNTGGRGDTVVHVTWFGGPGARKDLRTLVILYASGRGIMATGSDDGKPILFESGLRLGRRAPVVWTRGGERIIIAGREPRGRVGLYIRDCTGRLVGHHVIPGSYGVAEEEIDGSTDAAVDLDSLPKAQIELWYEQCRARDHMFICVKVGSTVKGRISVFSLLELMFGTPGLSKFHDLSHFHIGPAYVEAASPLDRTLMISRLYNARSAVATEVHMPGTVRDVSWIDAQNDALCILSRGVEGGPSVLRVLLWALKGSHCIAVPMPEGARPTAAAMYEDVLEGGVRIVVSDGDSAWLVDISAGGAVGPEGAVLLDGGAVNVDNRSNITDQIVVENDAWYSDGSDSERRPMVVASDWAAGFQMVAFARGNTVTILRVKGCVLVSKTRVLLPKFVECREISISCGGRYCAVVCQAGAVLFIVDSSSTYKWIRVIPHALSFRWDAAVEGCGAILTQSAESQSLSTLVITEANGQVYVATGPECNVGDHRIASAIVLVDDGRAFLEYLPATRSRRYPFSTSLYGKKNDFRDVVRPGITPTDRPRVVPFDLISLDVHMSDGIKLDDYNRRVASLLIYAQRAGMDLLAGMLRRLGLIKRMDSSKYTMRDRLEVLEGVGAFADKAFTDIVAGGASVRDIFDEMKVLMSCEPSRLAMIIRGLSAKMDGESGAPDIDGETPVMDGESGAAEMDGETPVTAPKGCEKEVVMRALQYIRIFCFYHNQRVEEGMKGLPMEIASVFPECLGHFDEALHMQFVDSMRTLMKGFGPAWNLTKEDIAVIQSWLDRGVDPSTPFCLPRSSPLFLEASREWVTLCHIAIWGGDVDLLRQLLEAGADPNGGSSLYPSPAMFTGAMGAAGELAEKILRDAGADTAISGAHVKNGEAEFLLPGGGRLAAKDATLTCPFMIQGVTYADLVEKHRRVFKAIWSVDAAKDLKHNSPGKKKSLKRGKADDKNGDLPIQHGVTPGPAEGRAEARTNQLLGCTGIGSLLSFEFEKPWLEPEGQWMRRVLPAEPSEELYFMYSQRIREADRVWPLGGTIFPYWRNKDLWLVGYSVEHLAQVLWDQPITLRHEKSSRICMLANYVALADVNDREGNSILHYCRGFDFRNLDTLVELGCDVNAFNNQGSTPLLAFLKQHEKFLKMGERVPRRASHIHDMIDKLCDIGAQVHFEIPEKDVIANIQTPVSYLLSVAPRDSSLLPIMMTRLVMTCTSEDTLATGYLQTMMERGHYQCAQILLKKMERLNSKHHMQLLTWRNDVGEGIFHCIGRSEELREDDHANELFGLLSLFVQGGFDINNPTNLGIPVFYHISMRRWAAAKVLYLAGGSIPVRDSRGRTPLFLIYSEGQHMPKSDLLDLSSVFASPEMDVVDNDGNTLLHALAFVTEGVEDILKSVPPVYLHRINSVNSAGRTPMMEAARAQNTGFLAWFLQRDLEVKIQPLADDNGWTFAHHLAGTEAVALMGMQDSANTPDLFGATPSHYQAIFGHNTAPEGNLTLIDATSATPLHYAALWLSGKMFASILVKHGTARLVADSPDDHGYTVLMLCLCTSIDATTKISDALGVISVDEDVFSQLPDILVRHKDPYGNSIAHLAMAAGHIDFILSTHSPQIKVAMNKDGKFPLDMVTDAQMQATCVASLTEGWSETSPENIDILKQACPPRPPSRPSSARMRQEDEVIQALRIDHQVLLQQCKYLPTQARPIDENIYGGVRELKDEISWLKLILSRYLDVPKDVDTLKQMVDANGSNFFNSLDAGVVSTPHATHPHILKFGSERKFLSLFQFDMQGAESALFCMPLLRSSFDDLGAFLRQHGVPTGDWGFSGTKSIESLRGELLRMEASLCLYKARIIRIVHVVSVMVTRSEWDDSDSPMTLVQTYEMTAQGQGRSGPRDVQFRRRSEPPSMRMRLTHTSDADVRLAAVKCLVKELDTPAGTIKLTSEPYSRTVWRDSLSYPGLQSCYVVHCVSATVPGLPVTPFCTHEYNKVHFWDWGCSSVIERAVGSALVDDLTMFKWISLPDWHATLPPNMSSVPSLLLSMSGDGKYMVRQLQDGKSGALVCQVKGYTPDGAAMLPRIAKFANVKDIVREARMHEMMMRVISEGIPKLIEYSRVEGASDPNVDLGCMIIELAGARWYLPELSPVCHVIDLHTLLRDEVTMARHTMIGWEGTRPSITALYGINFVLGHLLVPNHISVRPVNILHEGFVDILGTIAALPQAATSDIQDYMSGEGRDLHGRILALSETVRDSGGKGITEECVLSTQHGDLNFKNIMVCSQNSVWLIDFAKSVEYGLVFLDISKVIVVLVFETVPWAQHELPSLVECVSVLFGRKQLQGIEASSVLPPSHHAYSGYLSAVLKWLVVYLQHLTDKVTEESIVHQYHACCLHFLLKLMRYPDVSSVAKQGALHGAALCADSLAELVASQSAASASASSSGTKVHGGFEELFGDWKTQMDHLCSNYYRQNAHTYGTIFDPMSGTKLDILAQCTSVHMVEASVKERMVATGQQMIESVEETIEEEGGDQSTSLRSAVHFLLNRKVHHSNPDENHLLVIGKPAAGKTVLLKQLLLLASMGGQVSGRRRDESASRLPVLVILVELVRMVDEAGGDWQTGDLLDIYLEKKYGENSNSVRLIQHMRRQGSLLVLLDGLDEVRDTAIESVLLHVNALKLEGHLMVLTSRPTNWSMILKWFPSWQWAVIMKLSPSMQEAMVKARMGPLSNAFIREVRARHDFQQLSTTPLLLSLLMHIYKVNLKGMDPSPTGSVMPKNTTALYQACIKSLVRQLDRTKKLEGGDSEALLVLMRNIAFFLHFGSKAGVRDFKPPLGMKVAKQLRRTENNKDFSAEMWNSLETDIQKGRVPLIVCVTADPQNTVYRYSHLTFQEYLAAEFIGLQLHKKLGSVEILNVNNDGDVTVVNALDGHAIMRHVDNLIAVLTSIFGLVNDDGSPGTRMSSDWFLQVHAFLASFLTPTAYAIYCVSLMSKDEWKDIVPIVLQSRQMFIELICSLLELIDIEPEGEISDNTPGARIHVDMSKVHADDASISNVCGHLGRVIKRNRIVQSIRVTGSLESWTMKLGPYQVQNVEESEIPPSLFHDVLPGAREEDMVGLPVLLQHALESQLDLSLLNLSGVEFTSTVAEAISSSKTRIRALVLQGCDISEDDRDFTDLMVALPKAHPIELIDVSGNDLSLPGFIRMLRDVNRECIDDTAALSCFAKCTFRCDVHENDSEVMSDRGLFEGLRHVPHFVLSSISDDGGDDLPAEEDDVLSLCFSEVFGHKSLDIEWLWTADCIPGGRKIEEVPTEGDVETPNRQSGDALEDGGGAVKVGDGEELLLCIPARCRTKDFMTLLALSYPLREQPERVAAVAFLDEKSLVSSGAAPILKMAMKGCAGFLKIIVMAPVSGVSESVGTVVRQGFDQSAVMVVDQSIPRGICAKPEFCSFYKESCCVDLVEVSRALKQNPALGMICPAEGGYAYMNSSSKLAQCEWMWEGGLPENSAKAKIMEALPKDSIGQLLFKVLTERPRSYEAVENSAHPYLVPSPHRAIHIRAIRIDDSDDDSDLGLAGLFGEPSTDSDEDTGKDVRVVIQETPSVDTSGKGEMVLVGRGATADLKRVAQNPFQLHLNLDLLEDGSISNALWRVVEKYATSVVVGEKNHFGASLYDFIRLISLEAMVPGLRALRHDVYSESHTRHFNTMMGIASNQDESYSKLHSDSDAMIEMATSRIELKLRCPDLAQYGLRMEFYQSLTLGPTTSAESQNSRHRALLCHAMLLELQEALPIYALLVESCSSNSDIGMHLRSRILVAAASACLVDRDHSAREDSSAGPATGDNTRRPDVNTILHHLALHVSSQGHQCLKAYITCEILAHEVVPVSFQPHVPLDRIDFSAIVTLRELEFSKKLREFKMHYSWILDEIFEGYDQLKEEMRKDLRGAGPFRIRLDGLTVIAEAIPQVPQVQARASYGGGLF